MATNFRPPKQKELTEKETISDYMKWQANILFHLSTCNDFAPYLAAEWQKPSVANRGLTDDVAPIPANERKTAVQKDIVLSRMLGFISQFAPSLLRHDTETKYQFCMDLAKDSKALQLRTIGSKLLEFA